MAATNSNSALVQMQKLANQTQVQLQKMVNSANELQTKYNAQEAQKSRDWQTNMSKTAHQMEVEDLKKAGLNPVLSSGGSGAQSYTTSSASAQPESGAAALASVQSSQLGALGNMESSRISAAAQRAAAAQAAAATRAAAAQSAAAQRYAAQMSAWSKVEAAKYNYKSTKYASDKGFESTKYQADASKWIAENKQASTPFGIFDKYANMLVKNLPKNINVNGFMSAGKKLDKKFSSDPAKYFSNFSTANANNLKLTKAGQTYANNVLSKMGISQNGANRRLVVNAYFAGNVKAYRTLLKKVPTTKIVATTKPGYR